MDARLTTERLDTLLPLGMVATKQWLLAQGVGLHAIDNALKSKKLKPLVTGVYTRRGLAPGWRGVVASLQRMANNPVHVGGLSALELLGLGHYVSMRASKSVHLYGEGAMPSWMSRLPEPFHFQWHSTKRLWPEPLMREEKFLKQEHKDDALPEFTLSCPEKAILEVMLDVPKSVSFEHADALVQGLVNLSPNKLDTLLKACQSVKAKRLFLFLATRQNYRWLNKLAIDAYDLGSGKRVVAKSGKLDKQFHITVPQNMLRSESDHG